MKTLIVDAHNAVWRLAHKLPVLTTNSGKPVQIVYGFLRLLRSTVFDVEPDEVVVCWDSGAPKWRRAIYPGYKASRRKPNDPEVAAVRPQMGAIKSLLPLLGVKTMEYRNVEADDLIAAVCSLSFRDDLVILTRDHDMLQLVSRRVSVLMPGASSASKSVLYTSSNFKKLCNGLTPSQFLEMRILCGDSSDEIPGVVKGFGEKTATELLLRYKTIENLMKNRKKLKSQGSRVALLCQEEVPANIKRNGTLTDLMVSMAENGFLREYAAEVINQRAKLDLMLLLSVLKKNEFESLVKGFSTWVLPFRGLR